VKRSAFTILSSSFETDYVTPFRLCHATDYVTPASHVTDYVTQQTMSRPPLTLQTTSRPPDADSRSRLGSVPTQSNYIAPPFTPTLRTETTTGRKLVTTDVVDYS